ncbi:uncharacterized protein PpBr36_06055 [Pyricularia pennisetigena]|uniref:uncharacterized protein n=1 Tax=Pyricularia pennisetigena TaxID=1578925 RepID=UPI00114E4288|nr:uncharacterized protein PpBr36_06055 [Pyricularia pennisetigena]TLS23048.1 hypothetical protein PpBr36_06055 [Pyricularia pennisetigena]
MVSTVDNSQPLMAAKCDDEHDLPGPATTPGKKGPIITLRRVLAALIVLFCLLGTAGVIVLGVKIAQGEKKYDNLYEEFTNLSEKYDILSRADHAQGHVLAARDIFHEDPAHTHGGAIAVASDNIVSDMATVGTTIMVTVTQTEAALVGATSADTTIYDETTTVVVTVPTLTVTDTTTTATVTTTVYASSQSLVSYTNPFGTSAVAPISASVSDVGNCVPVTVTVYYPSAPWSIGLETSALTSTTEISSVVPTVAMTETPSTVIPTIVTPSETTSELATTPTTTEPTATPVQETSGVLPISGSLASMSNACSTKTETTTTTASADRGLETSSALPLSTVSGTTTWTSYSTIVVTVSKPAATGPQEIPLPPALATSSSIGSIGSVTSLILETSSVGVPMFRNITTTTVKGTARSFYNSPHPAQSTYVTSGGVKQAGAGLGGNGNAGSGAIHYCVFMLISFLLIVV